MRQQLYYCDVNFLTKETRLLRQSIRANLYVHLAAALEVHLVRTLETLATEITAANVPAQDLRLSLFAMSSGAQFSSLADVRGLKNWLRRCEVLDAIQQSTPIAIDTTHLPHDGRTIRPEHLAAVWQVFGLPGSPLPGPMHALALSDLADSRNDVAHGNETIARVAGRKAPADMVKLVGRVEEVAVNLYSVGVDYLNQSLYLRV